MIRHCTPHFKLTLAALGVCAWALLAMPWIVWLAVYWTARASA